MRRLFCYGKKDYCDKDTCTGECAYHDGSGSEYRKIDTEGDRFRSMNDGELADALYQLIFSEEPAAWFCKNKKECGELLDADKEIPAEMCKACIIEKLRQPVEKPPLPFGIHDDRQESGLLEDD